ncbi:MAG: hypothetical protein BZY82_02970 [SAR202 cluster bacterium Io17-Chloro-G3]|nr:MAG: hypothetical protein BZY82_02970 [SAR202 cluster bacterium Io17-Chloro-G3]
MTYRVTEEDFESLWSEWVDLLPNGNFQTLFLTPTWQSVWWQELSGGADLTLLGIRQDNRLIGIAPFMRCEETLSFLGDTDLWDYHDFIVAQGSEGAFYSILLEYLKTQKWSRVELASIPKYSPTLTHIPEMARKQGLTVEIIEEDVSPGIILPETWEAYLEMLSKKDRHELRRKLRRLDNQTDHKSYTVSGTSISGALDDFFQLMRASRQDKKIFLNPERERFFRRMVDAVAKVGALKLFFMEITGERVAGALCFNYGNSLSLYNSGYNPVYSALSVGLLLNALCLKEAIEDGVRYFDFMRGAEAYKYHLGARDVQLHHMVIHPH